jgi:hypothetical protein
MILPDFQGGLIVDDRTGIHKLDGITGQAGPAYYPSPDVYVVSAPAVHPDGTVFVVEYDNNSHQYAVVGIDAASGSGKFSVPLPVPMKWSLCDSSSPIVAGDGNAYVAYGSAYTIYDSYPGIALNSVQVLRVNSSGGWGLIPLTSMSNDVDEGGCETSMGGMITNADQGVLVTWQTAVPEKPVAYSPMVYGGGMAITAGGGVSMVSEDEFWSRVYQMLQTQDGSFVASFTDPATGNYGMVGFGQGGGIRWTVLNDAPLMATADGGVIGASGITYDQYGSATGIVETPIYSWKGNAYEVGSVDQVFWPPLFVAMGFWPFSGANDSGNGTAVSQPQYPPLPTCTTSPGCVGPREAIYNALHDLAARLADPTVGALAQTYVFSKLGKDSNGNPLTTAGFIRYLTQETPGFYDGLRSQFCDAQLTTWSMPCWVPIIGNSVTVAESFRNNPSEDAETGTPSNPLLTFFRPPSVVYSSLGNNLGNEGTVFHEALHGLTGIQDASILTVFGYRDVFNTPSCNITTYLQNRVLQHSNGLDPTLNNPGGTPCPPAPSPPTN